MSKDPGRRQNQESNMYELFSTKERAEKRQTKKETKSAPSENAGIRFQRPTGSVPRAPITVQKPTVKNKPLRPVRTHSGQTTESMPYHESILRSFNGAPQDTPQRPQVQTKSNSRPRTTQSVPAPHRQYTVQRRTRKAVMQRPQTPENATREAKDRNEALFLMETQSGEHLIIRGSSMQEMHAIRVPTSFEIKTYKDPKRHRAPIGTILIAALVTVLVMIMIYNFVQLNEYTDEVSALDDQLSELQGKESDLNLELVKRNDLVEIQNTAQNTLGMVKNDTLERRYVTIEGHDKASVMKEEEEKPITSVTVILD